MMRPLKHPHTLIEGYHVLDERLSFGVSDLGLVPVLLEGWRAHVNLAL